MPGQPPPWVGTWTGQEAMHRNSERFRINTGCPAVEPTEMTQVVIAAAGELSRELQRACRAFYPNIYGKLEV